MSNMDRLSTRDERLAVLKTFLRKLKDSEYDHATRSEILTAGLMRYYRKVAQDIVCTMPLQIG